MDKKDLQKAVIAFRQGFVKRGIGCVVACSAAPAAGSCAEYDPSWEPKPGEKTLVAKDGLFYEVTGAPCRGRIPGKAAIVTGGAQGFGFGIAKALVAEGAYVVIADVNEPLARKAAEELDGLAGEKRAAAVRADVTDEESVEALMNAAVMTFGGIDLLVNNAGIVRAGSLEDMTLANMDLVTKVNYTAYFLCAKYASEAMKAAHECNPGLFCDIIQINSKSGLVGSNKNFAYAGTKFGTIGLTQSFALELAPYNIKVNSICPGNFLDGPLWSDPEKGLFVQYLNAGKVPGARTVEDVRRFYEAKVPMNRGCLPEDVSKAIFYAIEQTYETGQAIPVTGGQVMLN
ncbi:MAG: SDR family NAD(P)-dependent oxidoreductase [Abditibacteriota bacterium]|nr:SDR family NAD(P)-dependent oxidoreductase [Abditibacteriota bacterium]